MASISRPTPFVAFPHKPLPSNLLSSVAKKQCHGIFGPFDAGLLAKTAAVNISSNSDANPELVEEVMRDFLALAHQDCISHEGSTQVAHSCWLCIRMTLPTDDWAEPRWHQDGRMFNCSCPEPKLPHSKYAFTLLGPSTRVLEPSAYVDEVLASLRQSGQTQHRSRSELATKLADCPEVDVQLGQFIRFSWGQIDSPMHSEPDSTGVHRVFISVLYGSEEEIRDMCRVREAEYGQWKT
ncbi:hypothetical protein G7Y89_g12843 [Cudoniella acicularis]|uniref:Uncharacterized protein n=1 Tax=Cudoniella acicularis TaxID=354080 RepID=A0A8H4R9M6_9HELO|nr:hypothetical protein G7Y89_g12843 [Cudoniella acicularis]